MSSLLLRDQLINECWVPSDFRAPPTDPQRGPHFPVEVWGVVDHTSLPFKVQQEVYADVVTYWPALRKWTATFAARGDEEARDYEIRVLYWQPLPPIRR